MTINVITSITAPTMYLLNYSRGDTWGALQPVEMGGRGIQTENNCTEAILQQEGLWD